MAESPECVVVSEQLLEDGTVRYHQAGELDVFDFELSVRQQPDGGHFICFHRPDGSGMAIDVRMLKGMMPRLNQLAFAGCVPEEGLTRPPSPGHWWFMAFWLVVPQHLVIEPAELYGYQHGSGYAGYRWWPFKPVIKKD